MKWQRNYWLSVGIPRLKKTIIIEPPFSAKFSIKRDLSVNPNSAKITIYNLNKEHRADLHKDKFNTGEYWPVMIKAGYGDVLFTIFKGNIREAFSERTGTDWITTIDAFDGEYAMQNRQWAESLSSGGDLNGIFTGAAGLGLDIGYVLQGIAPRSKRGQAINGDLKSVLDTSAPDGWFIDNEELYVVGKDRFIQDKDMVYKISSEQLLATPKKQDRILKCETLFYPQARIGRVIDLDTTVQQYSHQYQIAEISHEVTISGAEGGDAKTTLSLYLGQYPQEPVLIGGNV